MESEELKLLRENNLLLKQILLYLSNNQPSDLKEFILNVLANGICRY